ncbi:MAG: hypothetical protein JSR45_13595 [Proteobacteria bacterium]|nr:hypothetical protein [Pseudomonadota bacterium]
MRPSPFPTPAATGQVRESGGARAAQRAFFEAALGKVEAPAAPAPTRPAVETPARPQPPQPTVTRINIPDEPPSRLMRPGSFVDIKV